MAFARDVYTASAAQTDFTISFAYIDATHVTVYKDGVLQTEGSGNDYTIVSSTIVRFNSGLTGGEAVVIQRSTSQSTRLVDYATASTLTEEDLDNDSLQAFYMSQESIDIANQAMGKTTAEEWDFENTKSDNVPTPTAGDQVANKAYVDAQVIASGNVPTPDDPGDDGFILTASGGTFDWVAGNFVGLTGNETIAGDKTFSGTTTISGALAATSTLAVTGTATFNGAMINVLADDGAAAGPTWDLFRDSASPAVSDVLAAAQWNGRNSSAAKVTYGEMDVVINDPTASSEDSNLRFKTVVAGTKTVGMQLQAGLLLGTATGGDKGAGTINASEYYLDGVQNGGGKWRLHSSSALSGSSVTFSDIPSWATEIKVILIGASATASDDFALQIGDSGGIEATGYTSVCNSITSTSASENSLTSGFRITDSAVAAQDHSCVVELMNTTGNEWVSAGIFHKGIVGGGASCGVKTLSAALDRVRVIPLTGNWDAGTGYVWYR